MAITIIRTPVTNTPAHNPVVALVSSNNTGQVNFRYVCDVIISSVRVARLFQYPDQNDQAAFDVSAIIRKYVYVNALPPLGVAQLSTFYIDYKLEFGEQYGTNYMVYADQAEYSGRATNVALNYEQFATIMPSTTLLPAGKLNVRPAQNKVVPNQVFYGNCSQGINTDTAVSFYRTVNGIESFVSSGTINLAFPFYSMRASGVITSDAESVRIQTNDDSFNESYAVIQPCVYGSTVLHFLTGLGVFDWQVFDLNNEQRISVRRETYEREPALNASNQYDTFATGVRPWYVTGQRRQRLVTDWMTDQELSYLENMITSPIVYMETQTGLVAVNIVTTDYATKPWERLSLLEVEIELSNPINRQQL